MSYFTHISEGYRRFTVLLAVASLMASTGCGPGAEHTSGRKPPTETVPASGRGITGASTEGPDFRVPGDVPEGKHWRYGLILPFQVAPRTGAAFLNARIRNGVMGHKWGHGDYEVGNDVVLFQDISQISTEPALVLTRNHDEPNPKSIPPNQPSIMVKYPMRGGFIPLQAKRPDGSVYAHAGTGFGVSVALARRKAANDHPNGATFTEAENYQYYEIFQLAYDGSRLKMTDSARVPPDQMVSGWWVSNSGLSNAIPSGEDLILGMTCYRFKAAVHPKNPTAPASGVMRWSRNGGKWQPISFAPVSPPDNSSESSLIRGLDGSLLFAVRPGPADFHAVQVWRSQDEGESWEKIIDVRGLISIAPVTVNRGLDGTPYIASNIYLVPTDPIDKSFKLFRDRKGRIKGGGWTRQKLYFWPFTKDRKGLEAPILARDPRAEFGPPPGGSMWRVDHPSSAIIQLADGKWHNVVGYRIHEDVEDHDKAMPAQTGAYLEEVVSAGTPIPAWDF